MKTPKDQIKLLHKDVYKEPKLFEKAKKIQKSLYEITESNHYLNQSNDKNDYKHYVNNKYVMWLVKNLTTIDSTIVEGRTVTDNVSVNVPWVIVTVCVVTDLPLNPETL